MIKRKRNMMIVLLSLIGFFVMAISIQTYTDEINDRLLQTMGENIREITEQQEASFNNSLTKEITLLESVGQTLVTLEHNVDAMLAFSNEISDYGLFENVMIIDESGVGLDSNGEIINFSELEYLDEVMQGKVVISDPQISSLTGDNVVYIGTPIRENDIVVGGMFAEVSAKYINTILLPVYDGEGKSFVINYEGNIIASSIGVYPILEADRNLFHGFKHAAFSDGLSADQIFAEIREGKSVSFEFYLNGEAHIAVYEKLVISDWGVITVVPEQMALQNAQAITSQVNLFSGVVIVCFALLVFLILLIHRQSVAEVENAAYVDEVTGIANIAKFRKDLRDILKNHSDKKLAIVKFDIVNFKVINELYSYDSGNKVLIAIASVGKEVSAKPFIQARMGVDQFIMVGPMDLFENFEEVRQKQGDLFKKLTDFIKGHKIQMRYGRYVIAEGLDDVDDIIGKVTLAHNYAKANQLDSICDYDEGFHQRILRISEITNKMENALINEEFKLHLQPKYNLKSKEIVGAEALVRWVESDGTIIFPNDFIPIFEQNGFISTLDSFMVKQACKMLQGWIKANIKCVTISVNFSRNHLQNPHFVDELVSIVDAYEVPRQYIEVELTENTILDNEDAIRRVVSQLHECGFTLSMDDFGSGYSSLGLLKNLDVDVIKLDRSFFDDADSSHKANKVVEHMINMAKELQIETVAEGVETMQHVEFLQSIHCDIAQGYYFARPMPVEKFDQMYQNEQKSKQ